MTPPSPPALPPDVLAAASTLVEAHGPSGLTMDALARALGLSRATLYRQVGSREAVLDALAATGQLSRERKDVRARIFEGAIAVFSRAGFEGATMDEIAQEAGVGTATVYRHFRDKETLVAAFIDSRALRRASREVSTSPTGELRVDLERLAEGILTGLRTEEAVMRLMLIEQLRGGPLLHRVRAMSPIRTQDLLIGLLRPHVEAGRLRPAEPPLLAQLFTGMVMSFGLFGPVMAGIPHPDPVATAQLIVQTFLEGAASPELRPSSPLPPLSSTQEEMP